MTPNLKRLFEYKHLTGLKADLADCSTGFRRRKLFEDHGEALVAALENVIADYGHLLDGLECDHDVGMCSCGERRHYRIAKELLATIEKDAGAA